VSADKTSTPTEWFLEVQGTRTGPYTPEQLVGLLEDGEIPPQTRVTTERLNGEWISIEELAHALAPPPAEAPARGGRIGFQPPPRPSEKELRPSEDSGANPARDPTNGLFDALLAARERKTAAKLLPPEAGEWGTPARTPFRLPRQAALIAVLVALLGLSIYGLVRLTSKTVTTGAPVAGATPPPPPPPLPPAPASVDTGETTPAPTPAAKSMIFSTGTPRTRPVPVVAPGSDSGGGLVSRTAQEQADKDRDEREREMDRDRERERDLERDRGGEEQQNAGGQPNPATPPPNPEDANTPQEHNPNVPAGTPPTE
jgi:hypothetical protein